MASSARIFFAGVGTTFVILAMGFSGGILLANSTSNGAAAQKHAMSEPPTPARIVYPSSAEAALPVAAVPIESTPAPPPQPSAQAASTSEAQPQSQVEERSKTRRELRADRRQRYAERRARRHERRFEVPTRREPGMMAFDGNAAPSGGFFGN
jgi:type IV secretory pathway VirB10-like protein